MCPGGNCPGGKYRGKCLGGGGGVTCPLFCLVILLLMVLYLSSMDQLYQISLSF